MRRIVVGTVLTTLLAAGCPAPTPEIGPSPSDGVSASPSPTATPKKKKRIPKAKQAIYATGSAIVLYDVGTDTLSPIASGKGLDQPEWLSKKRIAFVQRSSSSARASIIRLDLDSGVQEPVVTEDDGIYAYDFTPTQSAVAYVSVDKRSYPSIRIRSLVGSGDLLTAGTLARALGREATPAEQLSLEWSPDGSYLLVVFTPADGDGTEVPPPEQGQLQVIGADGSRVFSADPAGEPTMATWAPNGKRIYYRTDAGARVWIAKTGAVETVSGGTRWFNPWISPDGRSLAYDTGEFSARVEVKVLDLRSGATRALPDRGIFHPVFATADAVWVQGIAKCRRCLGGTKRTDTVYRYRLSTGKRREIALKSLAGIDVRYG